MSDLKASVQAVLQRICDAEQAHGRVAGSVALLAVSKGQGPEMVRQAVEAGLRCFGESYVREAQLKMAVLAGLGLEWHFIGPIQANKTRFIAEQFHWVHSVDRLKIAERLNEQRPPQLPPLQVCLQVNISGEPSKSGVLPGDLPGLIKAVTRLPRLRLRGLMAIPAPADDFAEQCLAFRLLRECRDSMQTAGYDLDTLSMGMSGDLEAAIAEGATIVRVGTALFGPRAD